MSSDEQLFRLTEAVGTLNANVTALLLAQAEAAKQRETAAKDLQSLKTKVEDFSERLAKTETAADEYLKIKTMGRGYLAGAAVSGAIAGGSALVWFQEHIKALFGMVRG